MRKLGYTIAIILLVLIIIVVAAPFLIPAEGLKSRIAAEASQNLGRTVTIAGPVRFGVLPHLRLEAHDVSIANAPSAGPNPMAKLGTLAIDLEVWPLLSGSVALDRLELVDPVIALEVDAKGEPNWSLGPAAAPAAQAPAAPAPPGGAQPGQTGLKELHLGQIRLVNGKVSYTDHRTDQAKTFDQINLDLSLPNLDQPLAAAGSLVWNAKKIDLTFGIDKPRALLAGTESGMAIRISGEPMTAGFKGSAVLQKGFGLNGDVDLKIPSLRGLAAWTGKPLAGSGPTLGPLDISGKLAMAGDQMHFTQAKLALDAIKAAGEVSVDSSGARPNITGRLDVDRLDLNPYLASATGAPAPASSPAAPAPAKTGGDWSDAPIDLSGLNSADLGFTLNVGSLLTGKISIGKSALAVTLKDGKLAADLKEMALYQGSGAGRVGLDSAGALDLAFKLDHLAAQPFLKDTIDMDRLSGTGAFDLALASHGHSERELINGLNGKGSFSVANGAVQGIDLDAMFRNVGSAFMDAARGSAQKTDFGQLNGTLVVTNGIVKNDDLELKSPLLQVSGSGTADLPHRQIDYRLTPKLVANAGGQAPKGAAAGLTVPVLIQGPLDSPSYKPDLAAALQQGLGKPGKLLDKLKGGNQSPTDTLKGLLDKKPQLR